MFDIKNCGDHSLLSDAILQGIFMARMMDYEEPITERMSRTLFLAFLSGYVSQRPFTNEDMEIIPDLYAVTNAFWLGDLEYGKGTLVNRLGAGENKVVETKLRAILRTLKDPFPTEQIKHMGSETLCF